MGSKQPAYTEFAERRINQMVEVAERQFVECAQCGNSIFKKQYELNKHAKDGFKNHFCCK